MTGGPNVIGGVTGRRAVVLAVKAGVTVGLILVLWRTVDVAASFAVMARVTPGALIVAVLMLAVTTVITGGRWWLVLRRLGRPVPLRLAIGLMFTGNFFSQMLPSSVGGDAVRVWYARQAGVPYQPAIGSVLLERACGLLALAILVALGVAYLGPRIDVSAARIALLTALPVVLSGFAVLCLADQWRGLSRFRALWVGVLRAFAADTRRVVLSGTFPGLVVLSLAGHLTIATMVYVLASGLAGAPGPVLALPEALALVPAVMLMTVFPVSVAGWGVREGGMVVMLSFAGVAPEVALAISLLFGLLMIAAALPGLAFWLAGRLRPVAGVVS